MRVVFEIYLKIKRLLDVNSTKNSKKVFIINRDNLTL